jgi:hypothetical protein
MFPITYPITQKQYKHFLIQIKEDMHIPLINKLFIKSISLLTQYFLFSYTYTVFPKKRYKVQGAKGRRHERAKGRGLQATGNKQQAGYKEQGTRNKVQGAKGQRHERAKARKGERKRAASNRQQATGRQAKRTV